MPPIKFWLNPSYGLEEMLFKEFQDGRHMDAILDIRTQQF